MKLFACRSLSRWLVATLAVCAMLSCGDSNQYEEQYGAPSDQESMSLRIVTLAPALTKMIVDLDKGDLIVGVGQHDAAAPANVPVVGNAWDPDTEAILKARPTHVLMQVGKDSPPARLVELSKSARFELVTYAYPASIKEIADMLADNRHILGAVDPGVRATTTNTVLPELGVSDLQALQVLPDDSRTLGAILGEPLKAQTLWLKVMTKLSRIETSMQSGEDDTRPRVLLVFGTQPSVMASGPGSVNDELLRTYLFAENAAVDATVSAPTYDREALIALNPDVILLLMPNAPPLKAIDEDERLAVFRGLDINAVRDDRIVLLNDPMILLPSTNIADTAEQMALAIHPGRAADLRNRLSAARSVSDTVKAIREAAPIGVAPPQEPAAGGSDSGD